MSRLTRMRQAADEARKKAGEKPLETPCCKNAGMKIHRAGCKKHGRAGRAK